MALSDEDYGILSNYVVEAEEESITVWPDWHVRQIFRRYTCKEDIGVAMITQQYLRDFASFIILSEGRELP